MMDVLDNSRNVQKTSNCNGCKMVGSITFLTVAAYFYYSCKNVKPVYYVGIPIMISLAVSRALDLPPFKN